MILEFGDGSHQAALIVHVSSYKSVLLSLGNDVGIIIIEGRNC